MELKVIHQIPELAQEFSQPPQVVRDWKTTLLKYDFESNDGYQWTGVTFVDAIMTKVTTMACVTKEMVKAYNSVAMTVKSEWLDEARKAFRRTEEFDYRHYVVFFEDYGCYEFIAKDMTVGIPG